MIFASIISIEICRSVGIVGIGDFVRSLWGSVVVFRFSVPDGCDWVIGLTHSVVFGGT